MTTAAATPETVELAGVVESLYCQRSNFCAGKFNAPRRHGIKFTVRGYVKPGQQLTLRGKWVEHPKYGKQFDASEVVCELPATPAGIAQWLTWNVEGVGPVIAHRMTEEFGVDLMPLSAADPEQVAIGARVPVDTVKRIAEVWQKYSEKITLASRLAGFGLTQHQVELVAAKFGGTAATVIEDNPYLMLGEIDGLGWGRIDEIALKSGMPRKDERRAAAALQHAMNEARNSDGHTCLPSEIAIAKVAELLQDDADFAASAAAKLALLGRLKFVAEPSPLGEPITSPTYYTTPGAYESESRLWKWFARGAEPHGFIDRLTIPAGEITIEQGGSATTLDDSQADAVRLALSSRCTVITGGAGVGKTTIVKAIVSIFAKTLAPIYLMAPTGKAARRLTEVVGRTASTIHKSLGYHPDAGFTHNEMNPLPDGVYIVDEVSMCDVPLMDSLLRAMPEPKDISDRDLGGDGWDEPTNEIIRRRTGGAVVILIGDDHQLPSVGPGSVIRDLLAHSLVPAARLTKCHRSAGTLKTNTAALNDGEVAQSDMTGSPPAWVVHNRLVKADEVIAAMKSLYSKHLAAWGFDAVRDTQFMTAKHAGLLGTRHLNKVMQSLHQRSLGVELGEPDANDDRRPVLMIGDKVIHTKNNYELNVMNGTVGIVVGTTPLTVEYDDGVIEYPPDCNSQVELAYVLTPHKMQGSECPCAVVVCHKANAYLQTRNWLYTAASRARKTCVIIGDADTIKKSASRTDPNRRSTLLQVFAAHKGARP